MRSDGFLLPGTADNAPDGLPAELLVIDDAGVIPDISVPFSIQDGKFTIDVSDAGIASWPTKCRFDLSIDVSSLTGIAGDKKVRTVQIDGKQTFALQSTTAAPVFTSPSFSQVLTSNSISFNWNWDRRIDIQVHSSNPGTVFSTGDLADSTGLTEADNSWAATVSNGTRWVRVLWPDESNVWPTNPQDNIDAGRYVIYELNVQAVVSGSIAGRMQNQWANAQPPALIGSITRTVTVNSASEAAAKLKESYVNGGDSVEIARGLDFTNGFPDFQSIGSSLANPIQFVGVGSGNKPRLRGTGSREQNSGSGANRYRVLSFRNTDNIRLEGLHLSDADNMAVGFGFKDESAPAASNQVQMINVDIDDIGNAGVKTQYGSTGFIAHGGHWRNVGKLPVSAANAKGSGNGEPGYGGRGASGGHIHAWAAHDCEFVNVRMTECFGEMDIKRHSENFRFYGCILEGSTLWRQGAFTFGINPRTESDFTDYDIKVFFERCLIRNITSRDNASHSQPYGICAAAGNAMIRDCIIDLVQGDCIHIYQDFLNSIHKRIDIQSSILIADVGAGRKSVTPAGGRSVSNSTNAPADVHCDGLIVNVPVTGAASNTNETVIAEDQLHTIFAGSETDFANRGNLTAEQHVALYLPA